MLRDYDLRAKAAKKKARKGKRRRKTFCSHLSAADKKLMPQRVFRKARKIGILTDRDALLRVFGAWEIGGRMVQAVDMALVPVSWSGSPSDTRRFSWVRREVADEIAEARSALEADDDGTFGNSQDGKVIRK